MAQKRAVTGNRGDAAKQLTHVVQRLPLLLHAFLDMMIVLLHQGQLQGLLGISGLGDRKPDRTEEGEHQHKREKQGIGDKILTPELKSVPELHPQGRVQGIQNQIQDEDHEQKDKLGLEAGIRQMTQIVFHRPLHKEDHRRKKNGGDDRKGGQGGIVIDQIRLLKRQKIHQHVGEEKLDRSIADDDKQDRELPGIVGVKKHEKHSRDSQDGQQHIEIVHQIPAVGLRHTPPGHRRKTQGKAQRDQGRQQEASAPRLRSLLAVKRKRQEKGTGKKLNGKAVKTAQIETERHVRTPSLPVQDVALILNYYSIHEKRRSEKTVYA